MSDHLALRGEPDIDYRFRTAEARLFTEWALERGRNSQVDLRALDADPVMPMVLPEHFLTGRLRLDCLSGDNLGPLAGLQVYGVHLINQRGYMHTYRAHSVDCWNGNRDGRLKYGHVDMLPLTEFIAHASRTWTRDTTCAHCWGFSVRRLDQGQLAHYLELEKAYDAAGPAR